MAEPELPPLPLPPDKWYELAEQLDFSPKQKDVAELILRNRCDKQIEAILNMRHGTLRTHMDRIFDKAGVRDREALLVLLCAMSHGICPPCGRQP